MNGFMVKMAFFKKKKELTEEEKKKQEDSKNSAVGAMKRSLKFHAAGALAGSALIAGASKHAKDDPENFDKVKKHFKEKHGHSVEYREHESPMRDFKSGNKIADAITKATNMPGMSYGADVDHSKKNTGNIHYNTEEKDPVLLAHEHGHIHNKGRIFKGSLSRPQDIGAKIIGAGITARMANSKNKWVRRAGVAAPILATIPHLHEEARANYHAKKSLNELGIKKDVNKKLGLSYGAYGAKSLIPAIGSTYVNHKIKQRREKIMKEEENKKNEQAS